LNLPPKPGSPNAVPRVEVAWLTTDGTPIPSTNVDGTFLPAFITAPACLTTQLPAPYGQLGAGISALQTQIQVNNAKLSSLPKRPFPAIIGSERVQVISASGSGAWTVQRGQGGTAAVPHNPSDQVMSTPLPILSAAIPPYETIDHNPIQAQACVASPPKKNPAGNWTTTLFDIGDAMGRGSF
jgi:hypothetical protein